MKNLLLILKSGAAGAVLAFAVNENFWGLALLAVAILYRMLCDRPLKHRVVSVFSFGLAFFAILLSWMKVLGNDAWLLIVVLCLISFTFLAVAPVSSDSRISKIEFAICWVLVELIRSNYPWGGFRWGLIAYSTSASDLAHYGRTLGHLGLTFLLILMATTVSEILQGKTIRRSLLLVTTVALASVIPSEPPSGQMKVGIVQGGDIGPEVPDYARPDAVLRNQISQTVQNRIKLSDSDLVLWPENSVNLFSLNDANAAQVQSVVDLVNRPFLIGAVLDSISQGPKNEAILWLPKTGPVQTYIKKHLVPFGEYVPFRAFLEPKIGRLDQIPQDFVPGSDGGVIQVGMNLIGVAICFEVADQDHLTYLTNHGSEVLIGLSNNSTYLGTTQPSQQFQITRYSAALHNRAFVVATTTGVSGAIGPDGRLLTAVQGSGGAVTTVFVPTVKKPTFADRHPFVPIGVLLLIAIFTLLAHRRIYRLSKEPLWQISQDRVET